jgi:hypothetical protein
MEVQLGVYSSNATTDPLALATTTISSDTRKLSAIYN